MSNFRPLLPSAVHGWRPSGVLNQPQRCCDPPFRPVMIDCKLSYCLFSFRSEGSVLSRLRIMRPFLGSAMLLSFPFVRCSAHPFSPLPSPVSFSLRAFSAQNGPLSLFLAEIYFRSAPSPPKTVSCRYFSPKFIFAPYFLRPQRLPVVISWRNLFSLRAFSARNGSLSLFFAEIYFRSARPPPKPVRCRYFGWLAVGWFSPLLASPRPHRAHNKTKRGKGR